MANTNTGISWTDATWSPVVGCTHASPGCDHCYARTLHDRRYLAWKQGRFPAAPEQYHKPFKEVQLLPERLEIPLHWKTPRRVFVNSVSDLFHEDVPFSFIAAVFGIMAECPQHTFQILTKRPERMVRFFEAVDDWVLDACRVFPDDSPDWRRLHCLRAAIVRLVGNSRFTQSTSGATWPLPNVWLGTSAENQDALDERGPWLLKTPAAVRFFSLEPMLGPIDARNYLGSTLTDLIEWTHEQYQDTPWPLIDGVNWVIVGGESGAKHRPFDLDWARKVRDDCLASQTAFFFKQVGGLTPKSGGDLLDGQVWHQFPEVKAS